MKRSISLLALFLILSGQVFAGGFQINEHSARAMAMSGAFTAVANDASAVWFNPAGIVQLDGTQFMAGATVIVPRSTFRGVSPDITEYSMQNQTFTPYNFYVTRKINSKFAIGFGANNPFGLGTKWDDNWVGRYIALNTEVQTFAFHFVAAYELAKGFSVSAGVSYAHGTVAISKAASLAPFAGDAKISLNGTGNSFAFNFGMLWKPTDKFSIGATYKSQYSFDFTGTATSQNPPQFNGKIPTGGIAANLTTPAGITIGTAFKPTSKLLLSFDYQWVGWSSYNKLEVTFNDVTNPLTGKPLVSSSPRNYSDTYILRFGAEYVLNNKISLRGGVLYDHSPVSDAYAEPTLPDANRFGFNGGIGYNITETVTIDLAYLYLRVDERTISTSKINYTSGNAPFNGVYNTYAHLVALDLSFRF